MNEMWAALIGALVGGLLSAGAAALQTRKVLKHEVEQAAEERRQAQHVDEHRRRVFAADQLIAALADFVTSGQGDWKSFTRAPATEHDHQERNNRFSALLRAGSSHAHALPPEMRNRWDALTWMVRFNQSKQPERSEDLRCRDANDLLNYTEYMRQSLCAVSEDYEMPAHFSPPNVLREGSRLWGFEPEEGCDEPNLTEWHISSRVTGKVTLVSGQSRWYGPNGNVEDLPHDST